MQRIIFEIAERAERLSDRYGTKRPRIFFAMDLENAVHRNNLDLNRLMEFGDGDFAHDVFGIAKYLNHETGLFEQCFLPRCARA